MMKTLRAAIIAFTVLTTSITAEGQHAFLDQPLIEALNEAQWNELISVAIVLENEVDLLTLKEEFNEKKIPAKERAPLVEQALKAKASATQPPVLEFIANSNLEHSDVQTFWISNSIALKAETELVTALSNREDIAYMYLNRNAFGYVPKAEKVQNVEKSVGGIEPGLEAIGAPEMWAMGYTGHGRIAMTYDTGVWDDHPSHQKRFLANRMPLLSTWFGYDSPVPVDKSSSHGTHVTGTMLGLDTATSDTIGMAPRAYYIATDPVVSNLANVKPLTDFMFGYEWSLNPDGDSETTHDIPDVINNSWGFGPDLDEAPCPEFVVPVFTAVEAAGIANVFSAGNEGPADMTMSVPHNTNIGLVNSFTVGATSSGGTYPIASFSSRGPSICGGEGSILIKPEVSAPGVNVRSSIENGEYDFFSGTSMAAPHVSGAVLLLREAFPDLTGEEILLAIYNSATDLGEPGEDNTYGMGFVNVKDAYDLLSETHTPTPPAVLTTDIELVRIISPADDIICTDGTSGITPIIEVQNNGNELIDGFNLFVSMTGETTEVPIEVEGIIEPGQSQEVELIEITYEGTGFKELHVRIEPLAGEYDLLNNHGVYRFTEIPKYDWNAEGAFGADFTAGIDSQIWTVYNPDAAITWDTLTTLQIDGSEGFVAHMNHPEYLVILSQDDHLISPLIQNRPEATNSMAFDYFYRKRSSNDYTMDTLVVFINRSCGDEYMSEELLRLGGVDLWTNDDSESDALPETTADWRTINLNLEMENTDPFFFSFVSINRRGNNLLIDNIRMGANLSTSEASPRLKARIYPNPTRHRFRVEWNETGKADVRLYDISGRIIISQRNLESGVLIEDLNLIKGVYLVEVSTEKSRSTQKLVVN
ncbi:MAG TPA: S8 family peptidase [Cryomorphaceae bacterium]|nr:S8 family peptidase [Cryomorphaceae bacterium]